MVSPLSDSYANQVFEALRGAGVIIQTGKESHWQLRWETEESPTTTDASLGEIRPFESQQKILVWDTAASSSSPHVLLKATRFIGSSRLPKNLDSIPGLFAGLLKLAVQLHGGQAIILNGKQTACERFVRRIGQLFDIKVRRVESMPPDRNKISERIEQVVKTGTRPVIVFDAEDRGIDRGLMDIADHTFVLSLRNNGTVHQAALDRLASGRTLDLLIDRSLVKKKTAKQLLSNGATGWYLLEDESTHPPDQHETDANQLTGGTVIDLKHETGQDFLLHWTRRRHGPWPEQTESEFLDDLLFGSSRKQHDAIKSLYRILATERLLASADLTRDRRPVVCFSDLTFAELLERRVFRSHLSRWDFEPYGIAIRRDWLASQGAQPVCYGDEELWGRLPDQDRPFFQFNSADSKVDWSIEAEWRIQDDIDLRKVPLAEALVFVPSIEQAKIIQDICRWPIVIIE